MSKKTKVIRISDDSAKRLKKHGFKKKDNSWGDAVKKLLEKTNN